jgi:hydroxyacylglutathione hydrolase
MRLTQRLYWVGSGASGLFISGRYDCNVYAVDCGGPILLVDAGAGGAGAAAILENLRSDGLHPQRVAHIFLTHKHADHAGGAAALARETGATVACSQETATAISTADPALTSLEIAKKAGLYDPDYTLEPCSIGLVLADDEEWAIGELTFRHYLTPGHCAGHSALAFRDENGLHLFCGDTLFSGGRILLQNIPDCDLQAHLRSLERLHDLRPELFLPGHTMPCLREGWRHFEAAAARMARLLVPESYR